MASVYAVSIRTLWGANGPDPNRAYGELYSGGTTVDWPATLTSISLANGPPITDVRIFTTTFSGTEPTISITRALAQFQSAGTTGTWPAVSTGIFTASPASLTLTTAPPTSSVTSGTRSTDTGTSSLSPPTARPIASPDASTPGLATGAVVGIAIGCALVGLAIGLVAAFCFFQRDRQAQHGNSGGVERQALDSGGAYPTEKGAPSAAEDVQLSRFLLEATPDRDIVQETQAIGALIDQHVESYYHTHAVSVDASAVAPALAQLGFPLTTTTTASPDAYRAATLCLDPRTRQTGLRHVLTRVLLSSIDMKPPPAHGGPPSMLPAAISSFLRAMPASESDRFRDPQANTRALREWRTLSAFLLHPGRSQRTALPADEAAVAAQARELAASLHTFLRLFVHPQQQHQREHLQAVIEECARLGYVLLSHPSDWEFVLDAGVAANRAGGGVVVEAGLGKLQPGSPCAQRLLEPVVVSV
ncbi:hypothetical protein A9K55_007999 [Cordyceps militaris]|uniref:Uncharacterized protein n=1 Tax=Cordyceps militaris TaxID=73501 RepID=A0A2H4SEH3_CORMI|nr:hypothetical protein A9K55_007999 [Cordyceps militaris]